MNATSRFAVVPVLAFVLASSFANESCRGDWPFPLFRPNGAPRIDVIGPLGNRLPESYRRQYNRPTYLGGKVAAVIAPSSQEAMAWQKAETLGLYDKNGIKGRINGYKCPPQRVEQHYFYPKPWEVLTVGPRRSILDPYEDAMIDSDRFDQPVIIEDDDLGPVDEMEPVDVPEVDVPESLNAPEPDPATDADAPAAIEEVQTLDLNDALNEATSSTTTPVQREPVFVAPVNRFGYGS